MYFLAPYANHIMRPQWYYVWRKLGNETVLEDTTEIFDWDGTTAVFAEDCGEFRNTTKNADHLVANRDGWLLRCATAEIATAWPSTGSEFYNALYLNYTPGSGGTWTVGQQGSTSNNFGCLRSLMAAQKIIVDDGSDLDSVLPTTFNQFSIDDTIGRNFIAGGARIIDNLHYPTIGAVARYNARSFANNTDTVYPIDTIYIDDYGPYSSFFDLGSFPNRITIPTGGAGWYFVHGFEEWATASANMCFTSIRLNGAAAPGGRICAQNYRFLAGGGTKQPTCFTLLYLADGDYLELYAFQNTGGSKSTDGVNIRPGEMTAVRVQGGPTLAGVRVYRNSTQSVGASTTTQAVYNVETRDDGGFCDMSGGTASRFTVPAGEDGLYAITAYTRWAAGTGSARGSRIRINGAADVGFHYIDSNSTALNTPAICTGAIVRLNEGDFVEHMLVNLHSASVNTDADQSNLAMVRLDKVDGMKFPYDPVTYPIFTESLLHFDGADGSTTIADSVKTTSWTANGNAQLDTAQSKFGGSSLLLDGTGDFLSTADANFWTWDVDTTLEMWVRLNATGANKCLISKRENVANNNEWQLGINSSDQLAFIMWDNASTLVSLTTTTTMTTGQWYHIAVTKEGSTIRMFQDGVLLDTDTLSGSVVNRTYSVRIGRDPTDTNKDFNGWIDEFRFSKGKARYTAAFTPQEFAFRG